MHFLTADKHKTAFSTPEERFSFFDRVDTDMKVVPGTAMEHVLGSNLGLWSDGDDLQRDAARIMLAEINTLRRDDGFPSLRIPVQCVIDDRYFQQAFDACRAINSHEVNEVVTSGCNVSIPIEIPAEMQHRVDLVTNAAFTAKIRNSLEGRFGENRDRQYRKQASAGRPITGGQRKS